MNAFIVYWHPEPRSFNHAMFVAAQQGLARSGWEVATSDLHAMAFDPVSGRANFRSVKDPDYLKPQVEEMHATEVDGFADDIAAELRKLETCDLMIWQFPLWWFGLPAVLKGWVDRVFAMGRVYGGGRVYGQGVFRGKRAMLSLTTGGPALNRLCSADLPEVSAFYNPATGLGTTERIFMCSSGEMARLKMRS